MADKSTWYGVYHRDGEGRPLAMFVDGDAAQTYRRTRPDYDATMVAEAHNTERNHDVADHFKATADVPPAGMSTAASAEEIQETLLRNQIRSEESEKRRRDRIRAEVSKELDADERKADKPTGLSEPERPARVH